MTTRHLLIPAKYWPGALMSANDRPTYYERAERSKAWRQLGLLLARDARLPPCSTPVLVIAEFRFRDNHRRDTGNLYPTVKALLDGVVQAGTVVGDHDDVLVGPWLTRAYPNGAPSIRLTFRPLRSVTDVAHLIRGLTDDDLRTDAPRTATARARAPRTAAARANAGVVPPTRLLGTPRVHPR